MNELASKLFRTFFRSKKYLKTKKLEMFKVISKLENFRDFLSKSEGNPWFCVQLNGVLDPEPIPNLEHQKVLTTKCAEFADHLDTSVTPYI